MVAPSGEQYELQAGGYRAVVTECGGGLRELSYDGRPLVEGYPVDRPASAGRGQLLLPWPNRIEDGRYEFGGREHQLPVNELSRGNASHGLTRWAAWTLEESTDHSVSLVCRLMAQPGYPWTLDLHVLHDLSADGLTVTVTATNLSPEPAPFAQGAHPYLVVGPGPVNGWELTLPAATRVLVDDERLLPVGREEVAGTPYDFRTARPVGDLVLDHAFTDLDREPDGRAQVVLSDPGSGTGVVLWMDERHGWVQLFSGDTLDEGARQALAVEPMTAGANAFRSGEDLVVLAPAGQPGDEHSSSWGVRAL